MNRAKQLIRMFVAGGLVIAVVVVLMIVFLLDAASK